jgi:hypothetical protein
VIEQGRLLFSSGLTANNYYSYRLYRNDLTAEQKALFLGFFEGWRWQVAVNQQDASILVFDKLVFSRLMESWAIPQPRCLGVFGLPNGLQDESGPSRLRMEFERFLSEPDRENFFLKPIQGRGGSGNISVGACIRPGEEWELLPSRRRVTAAELIEEIAEAGLPYMAHSRFTI